MGGVGRFVHLPNCPTEDGRDGMGPRVAPDLINLTHRAVSPYRRIAVSPFPGQRIGGSRCRIVQLMADEAGAKRLRLEVARTSYIWPRSFSISASEHWYRDF